MADITVDLGDIRGHQGDTGDRGSLWYTGTALTHTTGTATTATGITGARVGDMYLNTSTSNVYRCTTAGDSGTAAWTFVANIKGANGTGSLTTTTQADGYTKVSFTDSENQTTQFVAGNTRASNSTALVLISQFTNATVSKNTVIARGDMVYVALHASGFSIAASTFSTPDHTIAQLPSGYRPVDVHRLPILVTVGTTRHIGFVDIEPGDGTIQTRYLPTSTGTANTILFNFSFMRA